MKFAGIIICIFIISCQSKQPFHIGTLHLQQMLKSGDTLRLEMSMGMCFPTHGELQIVVKSDSVQYTLLSLPGLRYDSSTEIAMFKMDGELNALDSSIRNIAIDTAKIKSTRNRFSIYLNQKLVGKYKATNKTSLIFNLQLRKLFPNSKWLKPILLERVKPASFSSNNIHPD